MNHKSEFKATTKHVVGPAGHITLECETVWIVPLCSALKQTHYLLALEVLKSSDFDFWGRRSLTEQVLFCIMGTAQT